MVLTPDYPLKGTFRDEFYALQARLIVELVAIGCLVMHGDIPSARGKSLSKEYAPDKIFACLTDLNPYCFPQSVKFGNEGGKKIFTGGDAVYLTLDQLTKLYGCCGDLLHRGNLRNLETAAQARAAQFENIKRDFKKLMRLLSSHIIVRDDGDWLCFCVLENVDKGGEVTITLGSKTKEWD